jgi:hypothetical protein
MVLPVIQDILDLPIQERRYYTLLHNERVERENEEMKCNTPMHDMDAVQKNDRSGQRRAKCRNGKCQFIIRKFNR